MLEIFLREGFLALGILDFLDVNAVRLDYSRCKRLLYEVLAILSCTR